MGRDHLEIFLDEFSDLFFLLEIVTVDHQNMFGLWEQASVLATASLRLFDRYETRSFVFSCPKGFHPSVWSWYGRSPMERLSGLRLIQTALILAPAKSASLGEESLLIFE